ncbi:MAG: NAD(P)-binding domain-containing protein, partial [Chloroflexota bacterium]
MNIGIVGAGKVGQTLAIAWQTVGITVSAIYSRTPQRANALAERVSSDTAIDPATVVAASDITFLTVPDDAIVSVAQNIVSQDIDCTGKAIVHTSGAHSVNALAPLAEAGAVVGSLHPALPFADVETAVRAVRGATFAIETNDSRLDSQLAH